MGLKTHSIFYTIHCSLKGTPVSTEKHTKMRYNKIILNKKQIGFSYVPVTKSGGKVWHRDFVTQWAR